MSKPIFQNQIGTKAEVNPENRLLGIRHKGGMSIKQASMWNAGTCALMEIEKAQATERQGRK
jgi:hypothetical protein